ncbi:MAG: hypothetical protein M3O70_07795 [Actinomycetota bacterium]|nr:hypothetical protein [Actinomycetota bacterium]
MKATGILLVAAAMLAAGCGSEPTAAPAASATTAPGDPSTSVPSTKGKGPGADAQDTRVRVVQVQGAPPFYVEVGMVEPVGGEGAWGQHDLHVISEWHTPITVAGDDVVVDLTGTVAAEGKLAPEKTITLLPQERTTVTVILSAEGNPELSGIHRVKIQLPFWREASASQASTRAPDDVATVTLQYEIPPVAS